MRDTAISSGHARAVPNEIEIAAQDIARVQERARDFATQQRNRRGKAAILKEAYPMTLTICPVFKNYVFHAMRWSI